jgi:hypothetical protein
MDRLAPTPQCKIPTPPAKALLPWVARRVSIYPRPAWFDIATQKPNPELRNGGFEAAP